MYTSKKPYMYGTGRRKSSVARVHLFPGGTGKITVNGRDQLTRLRVYAGAEHKHEAQKPEAWTEE